MLARSFKGNRTFIDNLNPPHLSCSYSNDKLNPTEYPVWENGRTIISNIDEVRCIICHLEIVIDFVFSINFFFLAQSQWYDRCHRVQPEWITRSIPFSN